MTEHAFAVDLIDIDRLVPNPANANEGDVGAVATAIAVDGWHGTCIAQDRGDEPPMLIAGEHRWLALRALQADGIDLPDIGHRSYADLLADPDLLLPPVGKVPGQILGVGDIRAVRKMLADNRASALSSPDERRLVAVLEELAEQGELAGSLFDGDDVDDMRRFLESTGAAPLDPDDWTPGIVRVADYARRVGKAVLGIDVRVSVHRQVTGQRWAACYSPGVLTLNLGQLGHRWFDAPSLEAIDALLIHELAHHYAADHLDHRFHEACCTVGARLRTHAAGLDF